MVDPHALPPAPVAGGTQAVTPDVTAVRARLRFDVATADATASATVDMALDGPGGRPALDLRQVPEVVSLDGRELPVAAFAHLDLGGGGDARMRVLDAALGAGPHRLEVGYHLDTPDAAGAQPPGWGDGGVRFDLWMSDLHPGRYLESWIPAPLCHDRFELGIALEVVGTDRPHVVVTNGTVDPTADGWRVRFPDHSTSLSPMLVVAPADEVEQRTTTVAIPGRPAPLTLRTNRFTEVDADLGAVGEDVAAWLVHLATRYGPWVHGDEMTVLVWGSERGMEYDGATTSSVGALEHEVFHSWFGRGVKPATAGDGWIDEAFTSWATASRRREGPRFASEELGPDLDPVVLRPASPWARHTPVESYSAGARLFSGVAHRLGGADRLRSAMAAWYRANAGDLVTTDGLRRSLETWDGIDLGDLWDRYVDGRG